MTTSFGYKTISVDRILMQMEQSREKINNVIDELKKLKLSYYDVEGYNQIIRIVKNYLSGNTILTDVMNLQTDPLDFSGSSNVFKFHSDIIDFLTYNKNEMDSPLFKKAIVELRKIEDWLKSDELNQKFSELMKDKEMNRDKINALCKEMDKKNRYFAEVGYIFTGELCLCDFLDDGIDTPVSIKFKPLIISLETLIATEGHLPETLLPLLA